MAEEISVNDKQEKWKVVARLPALRLQIKNGIILTQEIAALMNSMSNHRASNIASENKSMKKRMRNIEKAVKDPTNSLAISLTSIKQDLDKRFEVLNSESKSLAVEIYHNMNHLVITHSKKMQDLDDELLEKRKQVQFMKQQVEKKRKLCFKEWDVLQEALKKLQTSRRDLKLNSNPKNTSKLERRVKKWEDAVLTNKAIVKKSFIAMDQLVIETNNCREEYLFEYCPSLIERLKKLDEEREENITLLLKNYVQTIRKGYEESIKSLNAVEQSLSSVNANVDSGMFMNSQVAVEDQRFPESVKNGLPCRLEDLEGIVDVILQTSGASSIPQEPEKQAEVAQETKIDVSTPKPRRIEDRGKRKSIVQRLGSGFGFGISKKDKNADAGTALDENKQEILEEEYYEEYEEVYEEEYIEEAEFKVPESNDGLKRAVVCYDLENPEGEDMMSLKAGEIIIVTDTTDSQWWGGYKENDPQKKEEWFPVDYVKS